MIVITGATGTVGSTLMRLLSAQGVAARAVAHSASGTAAIESHGLQPVSGDLDEPESLRSAFEDCDRLFLLSPPHPSQAQREKSAIDVARRSGVTHVVAVSVTGANAASDSAFARWHAEVDDHLLGSGLGYTILRPAGFMQVHLWPVPSVTAEGRWYGMTGDGAAGFIDAEDVAACAAAALTGAGEGAGSSVRELTGPAAISLPQAAAELAAAIGRPVTYVDVPEEDYLSMLDRVGVPRQVAESIVAMYRAIRAGHATTVTDEVERLTGRPARSFRDFAEAHRSDFADA